MDLIGTVVDDKLATSSRIGIIEYVRIHFTGSVADFVHPAGKCVVHRLGIGIGRPVVYPVGGEFHPAQQVFILGIDLVEVAYGLLGDHPSDLQVPSQSYPSGFFADLDARGVVAQGDRQTDHSVFQGDQRNSDLRCACIRADRLIDKFVKGGRHRGIDLWEFGRPVEKSTLLLGAEGEMQYKNCT